MILLTLYIYRGPYHIDIYIIPCKAATCTWYYSRIFLSIFYFPSCVLLSFYVVKPSLSKLKYARAWITPSQLVIFMCRQMKFILLLFNLFIKSCGCIFLSLINATDYVFPFSFFFLRDDVYSVLHDQGSEVMTEQVHLKHSLNHLSITQTISHVSGLNKLGTQFKWSYLFRKNFTYSLMFY